MGAARTKRSYSEPVTPVSGCNATQGDERYDALRQLRAEPGSLERQGDKGGTKLDGAVSDAYQRATFMCIM